MCPPGHAEWGVCLLLEQVVCLTGTRQTAVCNESCRVGGPGWGGVRAGGQRGHVTRKGGDVEQLGIGYQVVVESIDSECENSVLCYILSLPPPLLLSAACLVLDGWSRQELHVGFGRKGQGVL